MALFNRVTIVGLGLIGGSLGIAIRRKRLAREVVGLSRDASTLRRAKRRGAIDLGTTDAARAVADADLVILATPVDTIIPYTRRLAPHMKLGSILTDVGSTKAGIVQALERSLPAHIAFVGGHPLAGSEARGIGAAVPHLFDGAVCILTPTARTDRRALARVRRLWTSVASRVVTMSPAEHDRALAATSHLSHLVAACLTTSVPSAVCLHAAPSFLDMTRLSKSDPGLWDDIFFSNAAATLAAMDRFDRRWHALRALLAGRRRRDLRRLLRDAKRRRDALKNGS